MKKAILTAVLLACCLVSLLFVASTGVQATALAADDNQKMQSTQADFKEFCDAMQGRWLGEVVWGTDLPGFGVKKGDKVTAYSDFRISHNGNVLQGRFNAGPGLGIGLYHYDAGKKQIEGRWVSSGGSVWNQVIYKKDGQWHNHETGSVADGRPIVMSSIHHFSDDGKTHRRSGSVKVDGKDQEPFQDIFRHIGD